jgi:anti-sigma B factor antagonist
MQGRITIENAHEMRRKLTDGLGQRPAILTVDLTEVTFVDSSAIATLLEAARVARGQGARLVLRGVHGQMKYLLQVTELDRLFEIAGQEGCA